MHEVQYEDESQEWISMATLQWSKQVEIIRYKTINDDLVKLQCDICGCWTHLPNYVTKESVLQPWTCAGIHWRADVHCLPTHPSVFIGGVKCAQTKAQPKAQRRSKRPRKSSSLPAVTEIAATQSCSNPDVNVRLLAGAAELLTLEHFLSVEVWAARNCVNTLHWRHVRFVWRQEVQGAKTFAQLAALLAQLYTVASLFFRGSKKRKSRFAMVAYKEKKLSSLRHNKKINRQRVVCLCVCVCVCVCTCAVWCDLGALCRMMYWCFCSGKWYARNLKIAHILNKIFSLNFRSLPRSNSGSAELPLTFTRCE